MNRQQRRAAARQAQAAQPAAPPLTDEGLRHHRAGRVEQARALYLKALAARPDDADALHLLGVLDLQEGKPADAAGLLGRAIAIRPDFPEALGNLGMAHAALGRLGEAVTAYRRAIAIRPDLAEVHYNLGNSLRGLGLLDEAIAAYRHTIALRPDYAKAHCNLSQTLLAVGDLRHGFEEYRWRWNSGNFREQRPIVSCAPWEGEPLAGKALLVYCEQGFGDCLQFIRYVRPLPAMAARVTVLAPPPLTGLFRSIPGIEFSVEYDDEAYDYHIPLMCLPRLFGTTLATIPADVPYLAADPGKVAHWARRLREYDGKVKVGLVWAGDPHKHDVDANAIDIRRSITLRHFAGLAGIAGVQFFSLQKGESSAQALDPPAGMRLVDMTADFHDFEDTAAFVTNLDLVVSVDTSVVHLAGALAKPVWVLSRFDGCWRWLNRREDSPWYPTARVFHQSAPGDWASVLQQVQGRLTALATETRPAIHTA